jgi:hypothetical protein
MFDSALPAQIDKKLWRIAFNVSSAFGSFYFAAHCACLLALNDILKLAPSVYCVDL